jgi:putative endonuclease
MDKAYYVYILASARYGTLYVGVTSDIVKRVWEHREGLVEGFTRHYNVKRLVWFETHDDVTAAITRERQIKKWNRAWKIDLIQDSNPHWRDLYAGLVE